MPAEQPTPAPVRAAARAFFPWVSDPRSLRAGPVYLIALSSHSAISRDGDPVDSAGFYLHRALLAIGPSLAGPVEVTGRRLGAAGPRSRLEFSTDGATSCRVSRSVGVMCGSRLLRFAVELRVPERSGWRIVASELRIGASGCYEITVNGKALAETIPVAVP